MSPRRRDPLREEPTTSSGTLRTPWIDAARGYGMMLVFYGHIINPLVKQGEPHAMLQFKAIYAFHMPLFFILAGFVSKTPAPPIAYIRDRVRTRLIPAWFFCALALVCAMGVRVATGGGVGFAPFTNFWDLLYLVPVGNHITWFLFCLVGVELYHLALARFEGRRLHELVWIPALFWLGAYVASESRSGLHVLGLRRAPLYLDEAVMAYALFRVGRLGRRIPWPPAAASRGRSALFGAIALLGFVATFDLNRGAFQWLVPVVMMSALSHGATFWFALSALLGSLAVFHFSAAHGPPRLVLFLGRHSLALLGLNGLFFHFVNKPLVAFVEPMMAGSHLSVVVWASALTVVSLLICVPALWALDRWLPWAVGRRSVIHSGCAH